MKRGAGLFLLGLAAVIAQGAVAVVVRPPWCPDFGLLVVLAIGLRWEGLTSGLILASSLGYAADLLSGSLLGEQALLCMFVFAGGRLASRQLNLRGSLPLAVFAAGLTVVYALALVGVTNFFTGAGAPLWGWLDLLPHAAVNAAAAPLVSAVVSRASGALGDDESARQSLRLDPGGRPA